MLRELFVSKQAGSPPLILLDKDSFLYVFPEDLPNIPPCLRLRERLHLEKRETHATRQIRCLPILEIGLTREGPNIAGNEAACVVHRRSPSRDRGNQIRR